MSKTESLSARSQNVLVTLLRSGLKTDLSKSVGLKTFVWGNNLRQKFTFKLYTSIKLLFSSKSNKKLDKIQNQK